MPVSTECAAALLSFRYPSLVEENPAIVVALLTASHLYNSPGRFFNICNKESSFVGFKSNGKSLYVITQQFGQVWWQNNAPFL